MFFLGDKRGFFLESPNCFYMDKNMKYTKAFHLLQPFYRSKWLPYSFGLLLLIGVDILQLAIPRFIGKSIDTFLTNSGELSVYIMWLTVTALLMFVGRYCYRQLLLGTTRRLEAYLRQRIFLHGLCLPLAYYDQKGPGNIMALMTNDITAIRVALGLGSILFVDAVIMGFASFVVMAKVIHFELSLWSILPLPVILCIATYMGKSVHQRFRRVQESFSDITDFSQEIFAGFKVVKGFAVEKNMTERFADKNRSFVAASMSLTNIQAAYVPVTHVLPFVCFAIALYFGGRLIMAGELTVGDLTAFIGYLGLIIWPVMGLGFLINMAQRGLASMERISDFLDQPVYEAEEKCLLEAVGQMETEPPLPTSSGASENRSVPILTLQNVSFAYEQSPHLILKNVNLTILPGEKVGIVGRTGAGKSTLFRLLLRLYEPPAETIFLGDKEIHSYSFSDLRNFYAYVPQDNSLFSKTIGENIAFDRQHGKADILRAAELAVVTEDIDSKPEGVDTELGERGKQLSGGQQQRVAIARAIIKDAPFLLLDDAFSALDYEHEARLLKNMNLFTAGRTTLIVSQRIAAVRRCDRIVVLDQGEIKEQGTHEELVARRGLYYEIYEQQLLAEEIAAGDGESL